MIVSLTVNGIAREFDVAAVDVLLDTLRDTGLTGTKEGCGVGVCGACTVIVAGRAVSACLLFTAVLDGEEVWTIEGIAERDSPLIDAFVQCEGLQCGACTPGQVVAAWAYVNDGPADSDEDVIRHYLAGNLCRCTGYATIVDAVRTRLA